MNKYIIIWQSRHCASIAVINASVGIWAPYRIIIKGGDHFTKPIDAQFFSTFYLILASSKLNAGSSFHPLIHHLFFYMG